MMVDMDARSFMKLTSPGFAFRCVKFPLSRVTKRAAGRVFGLLLKTTVVPTEAIKDFQSILGLIDLSDDPSPQS